MQQSRFDHPAEAVPAARQLGHRHEAHQLPEARNVPRVPHRQERRAPHSRRISRPRRDRGQSRQPRQLHRRWEAHPETGGHRLSRRRLNASRLERQNDHRVLTGRASKIHARSVARRDPALPVVRMITVRWLVAIAVLNRALATRACNEPRSALCDNNALVSVISIESARATRPTRSWARRG
jgi:hypothetical protein